MQANISSTPADPSDMLSFRQTMISKDSNRPSCAHGKESEPATSFQSSFNLLKDLAHGRVGKSNRLMPLPMQQQKPFTAFNLPDAPHLSSLSTISPRQNTLRHSAQQPRTCSAHAIHTHTDLVSDVTVQLPVPPKLPLSRAGQPGHALPTVAVAIHGNMQNPDPAAAFLDSSALNARPPHLGLSGLAGDSAVPSSGHIEGTLPLGSRSVAEQSTSPQNMNMSNHGQALAATGSRQHVAGMGRDESAGAATGARHIISQQLRQPVVGMAVPSSGQTDTSVEALQTAAGVTDENSLTFPLRQSDFSRYA